MCVFDDQREVDGGTLTMATFLERPAELQPPDNVE